MKFEWLRSPLVCDGRIIRPALQPELISDSDLPDICLRMHLVLETIEFARADGRFINLDIFDPIDTMESSLRHREENRLSDWCDTITRFAKYYRLDGKTPITITQRAINAWSFIADHHGILLTGGL